MGRPPLSDRLTRRSASFIGGFALAGRIVERAGVFGQILLIAALFGATTDADLYFIASIVPLTFGGIIGGALHASILPSLARLEDDDVQGLVRAGFWVSIALLASATLAYVAVAAVVVTVAEPAGSDSLAPWLAFTPIGTLLGLGAYLAAVLLRFERYVWPPFRTATATFVGLALSALALVLGGGVAWVALAVSTGYAVAFVLLVIEVTATTGVGAFGLPSRHALRDLVGLRRRFVTALLGGVIGGQVFVFIERTLAASLGAGAVAAISYGRGVAFTPGVVAESVALGLYPGMLRAHAERRLDYLRGYFISGLRVTLFTALATAALLVLYSESIVELLFGHGRLSSMSRIDVDHALAAFSVGVVGSMLMILTARTFSAIDQFRGIVASQSFALVLYVPLGLLLRSQLGTTGLALAFGLAELAGATLGVGLTARWLDVHVGEIARQVVLPVVVRVAAIFGALAAFRFGVTPSSDVVEVAGALLVGVGVGVFLLWWSDWPELDRLRSFARRSRSPDSHAPTRP